MQKITLLAIGVLLITGLCARDELVTILSDDEMPAQLAFHWEKTERMFAVSARTGQTNGIRINTQTIAMLDLLPRTSTSVNPRSRG